MTHAPDPRDGQTIYVDGEKIGSIHRSQRSHRWFYKHKATLSPARYYDAEEAATALREATS